MGLKQSIVLVNQYTTRNPDGSGSRGATPGSYVVRYMARDLASEPIAPIARTPAEDFIVRYMAREEATEVVRAPGRQGVAEIRDRMAAYQGLGGRAFGYGRVSLSHEELIASAADVQQLFDEGHTVMKVVLSFEEEYLKKHGVLPRDFDLAKEKTYRGNVDQLKLRMAIMRGADRMGAGYDDLRYVGVVQVDTAHVHAHLAMVDAGPGRLGPDGRQRGKINDRSKSLMRRGIDSFLDEKQHVAHMSSAVRYERTNVVSYIKKWAFGQLQRESGPQFLLSCLPEDSRLWRASTNDRRMRKPNELLRGMVEESLERPGSPMPRAMAKIQDYANERRSREDLTAEQWHRLVDDGRERIVERCMNGVYGMLKAVPERSLSVRTPMLEVMSMDYEDLAARVKDEGADDLSRFGFRLRTYSARLDHHRTSRTEARAQVKAWEAADKIGAAAPGSVAVHRFFLGEERYHAMCAAKYGYFLPFVQDDGRWREKWEKDQEYARRLKALQLLRADASLRAMKDPEAAEDMGMSVYGQPGGALVAQGEEGRAVLDGRIERMQAGYDRRVRETAEELATRGLVLEVDELTGRAQARPGLEYPFEQVKALDIHHMGYDFARDVEIGNRARAAFVAQARSRQELLTGAVEYLRSSGQEDAVSALPVEDVRSMNEMADRIQVQEHPVLVSELARIERERNEEARRKRTVRIGTERSYALRSGLDEVVERSVRESLQQDIEASVADGPARSRREEGLS